MFTLEQIQTAHARVKSGTDFPGYVQELKAMGVIAYDTYVTDGHTDYSGENGFEIQGKQKYPALEVTETGSAAKLKQALSIHQQGQTDYPTFCQQAAEAGVERWRTDTRTMTVTYFDKSGNELVLESIPQ